MTAPGARKYRTPATDEEGDAFHGSGRILVVDDEEVIRSVVTDMLIRLGYEVVALADGRQAVEYYKEHREKVDLTIISVKSD